MIACARRRSAISERSVNASSAIRWSTLGEGVLPTISRTFDHSCCCFLQLSDSANATRARASLMASRESRRCCAREGECVRAGQAELERNVSVLHRCNALRSCLGRLSVSRDHALSARKTDAHSGVAEIFVLTLFAG